MKILAIVPDPAAAYGLGQALAQLPRGTARVVAYGQATAAVLPQGLDVFVYPLRDGARLPAPFFEALVRHEHADVVLAPTGALTAAPVPALLVDLDPRVRPEDAAVLDGPAQQAAVDAVTARAERRDALARSGLRSVAAAPGWFEDEARLAASAAGPLMKELSRISANGAPPAPAPPVAPAPAPEAPLRIPLVRMATTSPAENSGEARPRVEVQPAGRYRDRHSGGRALVLASGSGLDALEAAELCEAVVIAVPEALPWLAARMGLAHFVCATAPPRTLEAAGALASVRAVLVHSEHLDGDGLAPRARSRVALLDLERAGGPALGWSDEMETGFFPGPGAAALALQWAHWLGASEIRLAGLDPAESQPLWPHFFRGARELLESRGIRLTVAGRGAAAGARRSLDAAAR
ncbi:MAG: hypothetical protein KBD01_02295 [Acidobacteria bacterium]|nr:hypothetical protein [Acidobacteriota bacterium]